jgi:hypothetical protein
MKGTRFGMMLYCIVRIGSRSIADWASGVRFMVDAGQLALVALGCVRDRRYYLAKGKATACCQDRDSR